jgi:hypothetical protein
MRTYISAVIILLSVITLCAQESSALQVQGVSIVDYGLYTTEALFQGKAEDSASGVRTFVDAGGVKLFRETERIPAVLSFSFGVRYIVEGVPQGAEVPITVKVLLPGIKDPDTGREYFVDEWVSHKKIGDVTYDGYVFEKEWELVPGQWTIQLYHEGNRLAETQFIVYSPEESTDELLGMYYYSAHKHLETWKGFHRNHYAGVIGENNRVVMDLRNDAHELSGHYFYEGTGRLLALDGQMDRQGNVALVEYEGRTPKVGDMPTGGFACKFSSSYKEIEGKWVSPDMKRELPFKAQLVAKDTKGYPEFIFKNNALSKKLNDMVRKAMKAAGSGKADYEVEYYSEDLISILFPVRYPGATNPATRYRSLNVQVTASTLREIKLSDVFKVKSDYLKILSDLCVDELEKQGAGLKTNAHAKSPCDKPECFTITPQGLRFPFAPYPAASGVEGSHFVLVPYAALKGVINPKGPLGLLVKEAEQR